MKSRLLLGKSRFVFGGVFFCLAYLPVLMNTLGSKDKDRALCCGDAMSNIPLELTKENIDFAVASSYLGDTQSPIQSLNADFVASVGDVEEILIPDVPDSVKEEIGEGKARSDVVKKVSRQVAKISATSRRKTINVAGYVGATLTKGEINSSFYVDAGKSGIPANVIDSVIRNLSEKVNFKHSLKRGDKFEVIYSKKDLVYAKITTKRANFAVYKVVNGRSSAYYFANGEQCHQQTKNSGFGQPLAGKLAVSDRFGWRMHPITHRFHNHSGVDLRALHGAPVYAIYDGVVKRASRYAGYGNCIDIQHVSGYSSRYAHLSRYAVRLGAHVKKGQVIGYVGSTGIATGSHLHLELAKNNRVMNPLSIKMIPIQKAVVPSRRQFDLLKKQIDNAVSRL